MFVIFSGAAKGERGGGGAASPYNIFQSLVAGSFKSDMNSSIRIRFTRLKCDFLRRLYFH